MKHPLLVIAGGLALLSGAALFAVAHPPRWMVVAAIDLAIAGVTLFGAFKVGRGQAVRLAVAALVPAFIVSALGGLSELEDSSAPLDWVGEVKFIVVLVGNPLVVLFAGLQVIFGRGTGQKKSPSGA